GHFGGEFMLNKLSALNVQRISKRGRYADGGGLYLQISKSGSKSWLFRYSLNHRAHEMGLGSANSVSLAQAREKAAIARNQLGSNQDPLEVKSQDLKQKALERAK